MLARIGRLTCSGACLSQTCSACDPGTLAALLRAMTLPEVPAPRVPPRSPTSLYDACVLMSGV